jgi:hypothetical protein
MPFVVGEHDGDQNRLVGNGRLQLFNVDQTVCFHWQVGDLAAGLFQALAGVQNRFVFSDLRDDVVAALAIHLGDALDGEIVRLGRAGGEDDLLGGRTDELGHLLACRFHALLGLPAEAVVAAGRVAELAGEEGDHCLEHARVHCRGGVVVHVDRQLYAFGRLAGFAGVRGYYSVAFGRIKRGVQTDFSSGTHGYSSLSVENLCRRILRRALHLDRNQCRVVRFQRIVRVAVDQVADADALQQLRNRIVHPRHRFFDGAAVGQVAGLGSAAARCQK